MHLQNQKKELKNRVSRLSLHTKMGPTLLHPLTGSWRLVWTQANKHKVQDLHKLSLGILPSQRVQVADVRQEISVEQSLWIDIADLVFDDGYEATWVAEGTFDESPLETCPVDIRVSMKSARLMSRSGKPSMGLATFADNSFDFKPVVPARAETIVLGYENRVDRDLGGRLAMLRRMQPTRLFFTGQEREEQMNT